MTLLDVFYRIQHQKAHLRQMVDPQTDSTWSSSQVFLSFHCYYGYYWSRHHYWPLNQHLCEKWSPSWQMRPFEGPSQVERRKALYCPTDFWLYSRSGHTEPGIDLFLSHKFWKYLDFFICNKIWIELLFFFSFYCWRKGENCFRWIFLFAEFFIQIF